MSDLDRLLVEAVSAPVTGWDFSRFGDRLRSLPGRWDFAEIVRTAAECADSLLDLGTGGGEWLEAISPLPRRTTATESWLPNVPIARARLEPLGVEVVATDPAPDNVVDDSELPRLPFDDDSFSIVICRHASYVASEVARVLAPGGAFLTQQIGGDYGEFYDLLGLPRPPHAGPRWTLEFATAQLTAAGLDVVDGAEALETVVFADVGALAWYLRAVPWVIDAFSIEAHRAGICHAIERMPAAVRQPIFWLRATARYTT